MSTKLQVTGNELAAVAQVKATRAVRVGATVEQALAKLVAAEQALAAAPSVTTMARVTTALRDYNAAVAARPLQQSVRGTSDNIDNAILGRHRP